MIGALAALIAVFLVYMAFLPLIPSSIAARKILCRMPGLRLPHGVMMALGIAMLGVTLKEAAVLFRPARYMYSPL